MVDLTEGSYTERELMMVKVRAVGKEREEMKRMADIFRGRIIDVTDKSYTIELTGDQSKNDAFLEAIDRTARELMRLGVIETVQIGRSRRVSSRSVREYVDTLRGSRPASDGLLSAGR